MAELGVERLLATEFVLDASTVAVCIVQGVELVIGLVDAVGCSLLPGREAFGLVAAGLIVVHSGGAEAVVERGDGGTAERHNAAMYRIE